MERRAANCRPCAGGADLQNASRVRRGDASGLRLGEVLGLATAELGRHLRLHELKIPALPQQMSLSAIGTIVRPGMDARSRPRLPHALRVREVTGVVIGDASVIGCASPGGVEAGETSVTSRTLAERLARSAHAGSSLRSSPYPFIAEPHPAALTTTTSTLARSNDVNQAARECARVLVTARVEGERAAASLAAGASTSQPSAASTRTVASFT